jgi:hypothetical protein
LDPSQAEASEEEDLQRREDLLALIEPPLTREEAMAMLQCFGTDDAFGLAWSVLHLIESAPGGAPISAEPHESEMSGFVDCGIALIDDGFLGGGGTLRTPLGR